MKALVTGAAGFIGQRLVERLVAEKHDVVALIHREPFRFRALRNVTEVVGDVRNEHLMKSVAEGCDSTFHLAGRVHALSETHDETELYESVNIDGTRNVLEGAIAAGVKRFVFFSSVKAMGEGGDQCLDEDFKGQPETAYGRTKLAAERLVLDYGKRQGLHVSCLRLPLVYGPGNKGNLFRMISAIDRGMFPPLPEVNNRRSMVHVSDVLAAALLVAKDVRANSQCYIVTDTAAHSTNELYRMIRQQLGKAMPRWHIPRGALQGLARIGDLIGRTTGRRFVFDSDALQKLIGSAWYSSDKIARELGYQPAVTFQDSLPELIEWYQRSRS